MSRQRSVSQVGVRAGPEARALYWRAGELGRWDAREPPEGHSRMLRLTGDADAIRPTEPIDKRLTARSVFSSELPQGGRPPPAVGPAPWRCSVARSEPLLSAVRRRWQLAQTTSHFLISSRMLCQFR